MVKSEIQIIDDQLKNLLQLSDVPEQQVVEHMDKLLWLLVRTPSRDLPSLLIKLLQFQKLYWPSSDEVAANDLEACLLQSVVCDLKELIESEKRQSNRPAIHK